ncbi:MAG: O-methyltransferase [Chloroflexi bacterium]|nr:O-methyltransferase [Chloroflexota bacterium]
MFHNISEEIQAQMHRLEQIDAKDRKDGTPRLKRLRQIPPETGKFLALIAANVPKGYLIEIGASAGYSTLWLSLAATALARKVVTFEILEEKIQLAKETFRAAQVEAVVDLVEGDALVHLVEYREIAFCFLDAEKDVYQACYDAVIPNMVRGGYLIADNAINHRDVLQPMIEHTLKDPRVDAMVAPIGKGLLICRKL